ncbi:D-alanyl-D-alanine carboxypeptidase family protein [Saccharopolyspora sp. 6V]|uniref:D-alanyl-D-alanine carboxypeptidase family protein n=1 Tax=Saccharopolyspora sp. 6V TaxID=2877239 RepID=UPI001CD3117A|nr:D-alanyl-D-alanine carboxypeptidase family protein [Saccharopolyspora sp. 6V]MCA1191306.1 D-alanyl-D-alanine carboxypeptidase [Saccharopolyspora sp. 6V]
MRRVAGRLVAAGCTALVLLGGAPLTAAAQEPAGCPGAAAPPPAVDTSEVPAPGEPVPEPLPVPDEPVGGARLGECGEINAPGAPPAALDPIASQSWVLADLDTGEVLAARDPHARHRPASTIKVLTALVAIRELDLSDTLVVTQDDADQEGSRVGLEPGTTYSVEQVLAGLIMQSGNDAAHALARKLGGIDDTVRKMNALADELGAHDTRAATPSGLDGPGMSTSAYDLALIFREAMRHPEFAHAESVRETTLPGKPGGPPLPVESDNAVLWNYPGALGGKTGFTDDARHTFIAAAERDGRRLVAVLMRGENKPVRQSKFTMQLLDHGFSLPPGTSVGELVTEPEPSEEPEEPAAQAAADGDLPSSPMFGTVGVPLTALAVLIIVVAGAFAVLRRRRTRLAAARRAANRGPDHP